MVERIELPYNQWQAIYEGLTGSAPSCPFEPRTSFSTADGTYFFEEGVAASLYRDLEGLDRADGFDGKIGRDTAWKHFQLGVILSPLISAYTPSSSLVELRNFLRDEKIVWNLGGNTHVVQKGEPARQFHKAVMIAFYNGWTVTHLKQLRREAMEMGMAPFFYTVSKEQSLQTHFVSDSTVARSLGISDPIFFAMALTTPADKFRDPAVIRLGLRHEAMHRELTLHLTGREPELLREEDGVNIIVGRHRQMALVRFFNDAHPPYERGTIPPNFWDFALDPDLNGESVTMLEESIAVGLHLKQARAQVVPVYRDTMKGQVDMVEKMIQWELSRPGNNRWFSVYGPRAAHLAACSNAVGSLQESRRLKQIIARYLPPAQLSMYDYLVSMHELAVTTSIPHQ